SFLWFLATSSVGIAGNFPVRTAADDIHFLKVADRCEASKAMATNSRNRLSTADDLCRVEERQLVDQAIIDKRPRDLATSLDHQACHPPASEFVKHLAT